jgi:hypothetical protein
MREDGRTDMMKLIGNRPMNVEKLLALCTGRLNPPGETAGTYFRYDAESTSEERNPVPKNPQQIILFCTSGVRQPRGVCGGITCTAVTNTYRVLVLTVCRLWEVGVARRCRLHVPTFVFLDVHVIVWVFNEGSRSRRDLRRQVAGAVPLVTDSVTRELYLYNLSRVNNAEGNEKHTATYSCVKSSYWDHRLATDQVSTQNSSLAEGGGLTLRLYIYIYIYIYI